MSSVSFRFYLLKTILGETKKIHDNYVYKDFPWDNRKNLYLYRHVLCTVWCIRRRKNYSNSDFLVSLYSTKKNYYEING